MSAVVVGVLAGLGVAAVATGLGVLGAWLDERNARRWAEMFERNIPSSQIARFDKDGRRIR